MATTTESLLLQVDIQANTTRLAEIQKGLNENGAALRTLNESFKQNKISADELAVGQVRLRQEASNLKTEQAALTKANADQTRALQAEAGSIEQLRAQLSLGTAAYVALGKAKRQDSEEGQKLQAANKNLSDNLKLLEGAIGDTRRNVGNYGGALQDLIPQLVKLQEQQKAAAPDSKAYQETTRQIGFVQKAAEEAGAKMGLSAEQTTAKLGQVAAAIRPATAELVKLEAEQAKVEKGSEAYTQIGFKVKAAEQALAKTTTAATQTGTATDRAAGFLGKLGDTATKLPGPLGQTVGGLTATGQGLLTATKAALAFIATPLGLFLTALAAAFYVVKEALTATDEGQEDLAAGSAALGAVLNVLRSTVIETGKFLVKLFTDPKQAAQDFLDFAENQLVNRVKAYSVIFDGLRNGDFSKATNGALQLATGVENVTQKTQALTGEFRRAAQAAAGISRAKDQLEDLEIDAIARGEVQRQQAERLLLTARDRNLTEQQRLKNLDEATRLEKSVLNDNLGIERERLRIIQLENVEAQRRGVLQDDQRRTEAEQLAKLARLQGEYEKSEQVRENRRSLLQAEESQKRTEAAKKAAEAQQQAIEAEIKQRIAATQVELTTVQQGSARELALQQQLVTQKAELEAAGAKKTAADRKLIVAQSYVELLKLEDDYLQKREAAAIAFQQKGDAERLAASNAEKKRQEDAKKENDDNYAQQVAMLERYLNRRKATIEEDYAQGRTTKEAYDKQIELLDDSSYGARLVLAKQFNKDTAALETQQSSAHNKALTTRREQERRNNEQRLSDAQEFGSDVGRLFAEVLTESGKSFEGFAAGLIVILLDSLEKTMLAAAAEAAGKSIAANPTPAGIAQAAVTSALIIAAFETAKAVVGQATAKPFNVGGIIPNDGSPNRDSVYTYLTPGEAVMTRAAVEQYGPLLGHLNAMAGGINFAPGYTSPTQVRGQIDGGLMARQLGGAKMPSAAEIGREVGKNVPKSLGVHTIREADARYQKPRDLFSLR